MSGDAQTDRIECNQDVRYHVWHEGRMGIQQLLQAVDGDPGRGSEHLQRPERVDNRNCDGKLRQYCDRDPPPCIHNSI